MISGGSKLAQKSKKPGMIGWERWSTGNCARDLKFDHTTKWYMHKPEEPVLENATHEIIWDFEMQRDPLIPIRSPDLVIIFFLKREPALKWILLFQRTIDWKVFGPCQRIKKNNWGIKGIKLYQLWLMHSERSPRNPEKGQKELRISQINHPEYNFVEIDNNSRDKVKLAVNLTPLSDQNTILLRSARILETGLLAGIRW